MRIASFNVNGLRAFSRKIGGSFNDFLKDTLRADIACIQEIKGTAAMLDQFHALPDYMTFSSFHSQKGRHGVSTFVRKNRFCSRMTEILPGRIVKTEHGDFVLYNAYLPFLNYSVESDEDDLVRVRNAYCALEESLEQEKSEKVVICGDLNACYSIFDHYQYLREYERLCGLPPIWSADVERRGERAAPEAADGEEATVDIDDEPTGAVLSEKCRLTAEQNKKRKRSKAGCCDKTVPSEVGYISKTNPGPRELPFLFLSVDALGAFFFSFFQRNFLRRLSEKYVDTFRTHNKNIKEYTCWNTMLNNRQRNLGTRIDYIFGSSSVICENSQILQQIHGSDHCPVVADFIGIGEAIPEGANLTHRKNNLMDFFRKA